MNDDRKFQQIAEQAKILFEHNIPYGIIADILNISLATAVGYKQKVEKKFKITLQRKVNKNDLYSQLLTVYAHLSRNSNQNPETPLHFISEEVTTKNLSPTDNILFQAAGIFINIENIKNIINGTMMFVSALRVPKIESNLSPKIKNYAKLLNELFGIDILNPIKTPISFQNSIVKVMRATAADEIKASEIKSQTDFIKQAIRFLANDIEREELTTATLNEDAVITAVDAALLTINKREAEVLRLFFGLSDEHCLTLREIGAKFGVRGERARQIKEKAIRCLKHSSRRQIILKTINTDTLLSCQNEELKNKDNLIAGKEKEIISLAAELDRIRKNIADTAGYDTTDDEVIKNLATPLKNLDLSVRARNILQNIGIEYLFEILKLSHVDIWKSRNCGRKTVAEIESLLLNFGFRLNTTITESLKCRIKTVIAIIGTS